MLGADESAHALRVLRHKVGDELDVTDGQGSFYRCVITDTRKSLCQLEVKSKRSVVRPAYSIHIALAPTKNHDRIEWFVEKATEIGVDRITFMICEHSERRKINDERLRKVAVGAMKQSLKAWLPRVDPLTQFAHVLTEPGGQKFIAHLDEPEPPNLIDIARRHVQSLLLIGPEGDFSPGELKLAEEAHFQKVALGQHRLRTETAALVAVTTLTLANR